MDSFLHFLFCEIGVKEMTDEQAQQLVEQLSLQHFNRPFLHKAYFNSRLKSTGGRYLLNNHNIELNKKLYDHFGIEELKGIILHELCHYHLHILGMGYQHRDADFRSLLKRVGAPRFCSRIEVPVKVKEKAVIHFYRCENCGQSYKRKRKMDVRKYCCSICKGKIRLVQSEI